MIRPVLLALVLVSQAAFAQSPLRVKAFPNAQALPVMSAAQQGFFEGQGLKVDLAFTQSSQEVRDGLAAGDFHVAHGGVDNSVAMVERGKHDVIIVAGGDSGLNELFVQPEVRSIAELKGRTVIVDAPNTAYALVLRKILRLNGLKEGDYTIKSVGATMLRYRAMREDKSHAAAMFNPPFSVDAPNAGLKSLGRAVDLLGPYQATGAWVMRKWATANPDALERYLAALIEATRWAVAPANREAAARMLAVRFKLEPQVAARTVEILADPGFGLARDARFDLAGFKNVLALRAEIEGDWDGKPPPPDRYIELGFYERALKRLSQ